MLQLLPARDQPVDALRGCFQRALQNGRVIGPALLIRGAVVWVDLECIMSINWIMDEPPSEFFRAVEGLAFKLVNSMRHARVEPGRLCLRAAFEPPERLKRSIQQRALGRPCWLIRFVPFLATFLELGGVLGLQHQLFGR